MSRTTVDTHVLQMLRRAETRQQQQLRRAIGAAGHDDLAGWRARSRGHCGDWYSTPTARPFSISTRGRVAAGADQPGSARLRPAPDRPWQCSSGGACWWWSGSSRRLPARAPLKSGLRGMPACSRPRCTASASSKPAGWSETFSGPPTPCNSLGATRLVLRLLENTAARSPSPSPRSRAGAIRRSRRGCRGCRPCR